MGGKQAAGRQVLRGKANSSRDLEITLSYKGEKGWRGVSIVQGWLCRAGQLAPVPHHFNGEKSRGEARPLIILAEGDGQHVGQQKDKPHIGAKGLAMSPGSSQLPSCPGTRRTPG